MSLASYRPSLDLKAEKTAALTVQYGLPSNQWQIEVQDWFATIWAALAQRLVLRVVGPEDRASQTYIAPPQTSEELAVCRAQRVRIGQGFSNISFFGMLFVFCLGSAIIAASVLLEPIAAVATQFFARFSTISVAATTRKRGLLDDALHLQRLAYKGQQKQSESGVWVDEHRRIPLFVAAPGKQLGPLFDTPAARAGGKKSPGSTTVSQ